MSDPQPQRVIEPRIIRVTLTELTIYDVSEAELEAIERGGPESLYLNFSTNSFAVAVALTIALATTEIKSEHLYDGFFIVTVVSYFAAIILFCLWFRSSKSKKSIIACIRQRRPQSGDSLGIPTSL